jgi:hypothetical protein
MGYTRAVFSGLLVPRGFFDFWFVPGDGRRD